MEKVQREMGESQGGEGKVQSFFKKSVEGGKHDEIAGRGEKGEGMRKPRWREGVRDDIS